MGSRRCDDCGRFMPYKQQGASWVFVPDAGPGVSYEEDHERCAACTERLGRAMPRQRVNLDLCCGINEKPTPKMMTRSQRRYDDFLRADPGMPFREWLGIGSKP